MINNAKEAWMMVAWVKGRGDGMAIPSVGRRGTKLWTGSVGCDEMVMVMNSSESTAAPP